MEVYFSHSYRDVPINAYFTGLFDQAGISLRADQKSDVWCMAKLERYLFELEGFVSIIPRRVKDDESLTYSPYIGRELMLARRARTPRVLFVDSQILEENQSAFPSTAVPFYHENPETELTRHVEVISEFRRTLTSGARPPRLYNPYEVTVIAGGGPLLRDAASHVSAILRTAGYRPRARAAAEGLDQAFDDIDTFESLLSSELCVFVLGTQLAYADVLLAMAHAHCIPSMLLRHDPQSTSTDPELSGVVRWSTPTDLRPGFLKLFQNYRSVFVNPTGKADLERLATPTEVLASLTVWDPTDSRGLIVHIRPDDTYVSDRADGVMRLLAATQDGRVRSDTICENLYERIKRDRFYYTFEPVLTQPHVQKIRTPKEIDALNCGTCIDFACLFAALLEAAHERPVIIVIAIGRAGGAHAVAGYVAPDAVFGESAMTLGDLRAAINRGEIVVFETTGAVEARGRVVGAETLNERKEGNNMLDYRTAKNAARRLLMEQDIELKHFVDLQLVRRGGSPG
jgi:hypothetical protein